MGVKTLLPNLPGGSMESTITGFHKLEALQSRSIDLDSGTLIYTCAFRHRTAYNSGDYLPAVREFQRTLTVLVRIRKWNNLNVVFDGKPPKEKEHEHSRRRQKTDSIVITSTFIAMCVKVCKKMFINYVVSPQEADMQVCRRDSDSILVCRDSDGVAYGHKYIVIVDSWSKEEYRVIDMTIPITEEIADNYPLYVAYKRYGIKIIHWWAATMGCDISKEVCGINGAGNGAFFKVLDDVMKKDGDVSLTEFATKLLEHAQPVTRLSYSQAQIRNELTRVSKWFSTDGTFYDQDGCLHSISGEKIAEKSIRLVKHMNGSIDPKSGATFSVEQKKKINMVQPHNSLHNSVANKENINGLSLPEGKSSVKDCKVSELKTMVIARSGNVTANNGASLVKKDLQKVSRAFLNLESENPLYTTHFNRSRKDNGIFSTVDTSERRSVQQILQSLVNCGEYNMTTKKLFHDVLQLYNDGLVQEDLEEILLQAPELKEIFIQEAFIHVGMSVNQKNISDGCRKVLDMDEVIYHANAMSEDNKSMFIISKQRASQNHDEKTRNKTAAGEKPKFAEYLVVAQVSIMQTTVASHGHTLGQCCHVMKSYCAACKAGGNMCTHLSSTFWMQHCLWGEGRPTSKPPTSSFCAWLPGAAGREKRVCSTLQPASHCQIEQLPTSDEEAKAKIAKGIKRSMHQGIPAKYDVFGGDASKHADLADPHYVSYERILPLFECLKDAQAKTSQFDNKD